MNNLPDWATPPEIAKALRVDPSTVLSWVKTGELRASNLASRSATRPRWRISREALEAFLAGREPRPAMIRRKRSSGRVIKFF